MYQFCLHVYRNLKRLYKGLFYKFWITGRLCWVFVHMINWLTVLYNTINKSLLFAIQLKRKIETNLKLFVLCLFDVHRPTRKICHFFNWVFQIYQKLWFFVRELQSHQPSYSYFKCSYYCTKQTIVLVYQDY